MPRVSRTTFTFTRDQGAIDAEAALDGIYVIRTSVPAQQMNAGTVVRTYKSLALVERDFRSIKSIDLDLRPIHHYTETRVRAHVFICMLAAYLVWHLRQAGMPTGRCPPTPLSWLRCGCWPGHTKTRSGTARPPTACGHCCASTFPRRCGRSRT